MAIKRIIDEIYQNPSSFATNSITYGIDPSGKHIVRHGLNCGEDIAPNYFRFESIEEARDKWAQLRKLISLRGYTQKIATIKK